MQNYKFQMEQKWKDIRDSLKHLKSKLSSQVLALTIGDLDDMLHQGVKSYADIQEHVTKATGPLANITNQTLNSIHQSSKASRVDDGKSCLPYPSSLILSSHW